MNQMLTTNSGQLSFPGMAFAGGVCGSLLGAVIFFILVYFSNDPESQPWGLFAAFIGAGTGFIPGALTGIAISAIRFMKK